MTTFRKYLVIKSQHFSASTTSNLFTVFNMLSPPKGSGATSRTLLMKIFQSKHQAQRLKIPGKQSFRLTWTPISKINEKHRASKKSHQLSPLVSVYNSLGLLMVVVGYLVYFSCQYWKEIINHRCKPICFVVTFERVHAPASFVKLASFTHTFLCDPHLRPRDLSFDACLSVWPTPLLELLPDSGQLSPIC